MFIFFSLSFPPYFVLFFLYILEKNKKQMPFFFPFVFSPFFSLFVFSLFICLFFSFSFLHTHTISSSLYTSIHPVGFVFVIENLSPIITIKKWIVNKINWFKRFYFQLFLFQNVMSLLTWASSTGSRDAVSTTPPSLSPGPLRTCPLTTRHRPSPSNLALSTVPRSSPSSPPSPPRSSPPTGLFNPLWKSKKNKSYPLIIIIITLIFFFFISFFRLGINVDAPQFVLVGMKGCGKTSILESLLGHPIIKTSDKPCK